MNTKRIWAALSLTFVSTISIAQDSLSSFDSLWGAIREHSHLLKSEEYQKEAYHMLYSRKSKHWLPRLSVHAQAFSTNEPGNILFTELNSRSLKIDDLSPNTMNHPPRQFIKTAGVFLDLPLYEGGSGIAQSHGAKLMEEAHSISYLAQMSEEFAEFTENYSTIAVLENERDEYLKLKDKLTTILQHYKVGSKENPVGYSGLLGMRALLNRLDSAIDFVNSKIDSLINTLVIQTGFDRHNLKIQIQESLTEFLDSKLSIKNHKSTMSLRSYSAQLLADAQEKLSLAENAKWLPRVGLFASSDVTANKRDAGAATEAGAYLQWDIFNATNLGSYREAHLQANANEEVAAKYQQDSELRTKNLNTTVPILRQNLERIYDSMKITEEQINVTEKLFRNGSINALQFTEVLSRRADVVENKKNTEIAYIQNRNALYLENVSVE